MSLNIPTITQFNGDKNLTVLSLPNCRIYFSYETPVAFYNHETGFICSENV